MYAYVCIYIYIERERYVYVCIYIYIYMYIYIYIYVHIYIYIYKGLTGSALMGSLQMSCFLTEGPFGYSRSPTFIFPKVPGCTFFPNLSKFITFAAAPSVLTPFVRNQGERPEGILKFTLES